MATQLTEKEINRLSEIAPYVIEGLEQGLEFPEAVEYGFTRAINFLATTTDKLFRAANRDTLNEIAASVYKEIRDE